MGQGLGSGERGPGSGDRGLDMDIPNWYNVEAKKLVGSLSGQKSDFKGQISAKKQAQKALCVKSRGLQVP